ncbi:MAG TPA: exosortase/archaeosortase family protein [Gemmatimonadales bacterium]|nr:exosortase/archaeosortase family protein [Gemmatimonadales bacterium]
MAASIAPEASRRDLLAPIRAQLPLVLLTAAAFLALFGEPIRLLIRDWWSDPESAHGLLLAPVSVWLAWKTGRRADARPNVGLGLAMLIAAVLLRYVSGLAAELFTMRMSMLLGLAGLTTYYLGFRQVLTWWLPFVLLGLSVPLPEVVKSAMTLPLQFRASRVGAALLDWRGIPVKLTGNIILVPGHQLFVTEACSGLRSLTALVALSILMGALWLSTVTGRVLMLGAAIVTAIMVNALRVFLTGFLVVFVDPKMGEGFMHLTEGWLLFVVSLALIAGVAWVFSWVERALRRAPAGVPS